MKIVGVLLLLALALGGLVHAQPPGDLDDSSLSPEAKALKARYDAEVKALTAKFMRDLQALSQGAYKPEAPAQKPWYENVKVSGYGQMRYWNRRYDSQPASVPERSDFGIRRFYMNVNATGEHGQFVALFCGTGSDFRNSTETRWESLFGEYWPDKEWSLRMGLVPTLWGLDDSETSAIRLTPDRAMALEGSPWLGLTGLYAIGPSDYGLWAIYDNRAKPRLTVPTPDNPGWRLAASVCNGQYYMTDPNVNKNVGLDATYFTDWGQVGANWLNGQYTTAAAGSPTGNRRAFGLNARLIPAPHWGAQAEWVTGSWPNIPMGLGSTRREGGYGQANYSFDPAPGLPFTPLTGRNRQTAYVRWEWFDPDSSTPGNEYQGLHVGYRYRLTPNDDLTLEGVKGKIGPARNDDLMFQYQRTF